MILLLDNYDSFVYNLARYVNELGFVSRVVRSDALSVADVSAMKPTHIILSPGPCTPSLAGICTEVVQKLGVETPILGICLGHQCIGEAYGGRTVQAKKPLHGKTAKVLHAGGGVFVGVPETFHAARYHSLVIDAETCPPDLRVTARSVEGEIMAVQHVQYPVYGVQFHPESAATEWGYQILANFLSPTRQREAMPDLSACADLGRSAVRRIS